MTFSSCSSDSHDDVNVDPDKLINFDKKSLSIREDRAVFNKMSYKYPCVD